mmetsp:Transcript_32802/g.55307  ORF Transcript_32802/g.55307 Transcript_32802/m.55307 type:complete len:457 (-) Transcript_32802:435-1805(-)|eukprot:CAMPEP_0174953880 /NCGR_PEP_ID=MMETSP0004_2-20121128/110_1 /TAXON_ID=420556 /ORGANISM="Ochromonas sp., Strain CCMP1393" /LENGTH=456 /DNA_ID=CAMNT_0016201623 /DNA_START=943 /DNA_END=2313 /DNA_ORIENTATION=+
MAKRITATRLGFYKAPKFSPCTCKWLDTSRNWHILYGGFLHNHLTHNFVVIGAAPSLLRAGDKSVDAKLRWWNEIYINHELGGGLESARPITKDMPTITGSNWLDYISGSLNAPSDSCYPAYLKYFDNEIATIGVEQTLKTHIPALLAGLAGSALHPVIHTGWGVEVGHHGMMAEGLASMCTQFVPLSYPIEQQSDKKREYDGLYTPGDDVNILSAAVSYLATARNKEFAKEVKHAIEADIYQAKPVGGFQRKILTFNDPNLRLGASLNASMPLTVHGEQAPAGILPAVEQAAVLVAAAYLATDNEFFVIHGATSLHAIVVLMQYLSPQEQREALVYWWRATMAVMVVQDVLYLEKIMTILNKWESNYKSSIMTEVNTKEGKSDADMALLWEQLLETSLTSHDEHVSKGTYVMWRWSQWQGVNKSTKYLLLDVAMNQNRKKTADAGPPHENLWSNM